MNSQKNEKGIWDPFVWGVMVGLSAICLVLSGCRSSVVDRSSDLIEMFDGKTLANWSGDPLYWSVQDGALVGEVTADTLLKRNTFIIWQGDMPADFELTVEYRITESGNSGINYRSEMVEGVPFAMRGYQADFDGKNRHTGSTYEERRRTVVASQGESVELPAIPDTANLKDYIKRNNFKSKKVLKKLGSREEIRSHFRQEDWNEYRIEAKGNHLKHFVNGVLMSEVVDHDPVHRRLDGMLGVQVHKGPPMKVEYRRFLLKSL